MSSSPGMSMGTYSSISFVSIIVLIVIGVVAYYGVVLSSQDCQVSDWTTCDSTGNQTRTVTQPAKYFGNCNQPLTQTCTPPATTGSSGSGSGSSGSGSSGSGSGSSGSGSGSSGSGSGSSGSGSGSSGSGSGSSGSGSGASPAPSSLNTAPVTYSSYPSTDYSGQGDISNSPGTATTCPAMCDAIPGCTGFTFNSSSNTCFFKNNTVTTPSYNTIATYYYKGTAPPGPATAPVVTNNTTAPGPVVPPASVTYSSYPSTDYAGQGDISSQPGNATTCTPLCNSLTGCTGFVTDGNTCFFKNNTVTTPSYNPSLTYYYKGTAPPGPATAPYPSYPSTDFANQGDISSQPGTPSTCSAACNNITGCTGFVYNTSNNVCLFKNNTITTPSYVPYATYYYKPNSNPPPGAVDPSKFKPVNQFIKNVSAANICLDVPDASKSDLSPIHTWSCTVPQTLGNQNWTFNANGTIVNQNSGLCLDITNGGTASGNAVGQYTCNGSPSQAFTYNADQTLTSAGSPGNCLDTVGSATAGVGINLSMNKCSGAMSQKWTT